MTLFIMNVSMSSLTEGCAMMTLERHTTMFKAPNLCSGGVVLGNVNNVNQDGRNATYSAASNCWTKVKVGKKVEDVRVLASVNRKEVAVDTPLW